MSNSIDHRHTTFNGSEVITAVAPIALIAHNGIGHIRVPERILKHFTGADSTMGRLLDARHGGECVRIEVSDGSAAAKVIDELDTYLDSVFAEIVVTQYHKPKGGRSGLLQRPAIPAHWHTDVYSGNRLTRPEILVTLPFPVDLHGSTICIPWSFEWETWQVRAPEGYATAAFIKMVFHRAHSDNPELPRGLYSRTWV